MILLVEDDELVARLLRAAFEEEGWSLESCPSAEAALGRIEGRGHYDLMITDQGLPGLSGVELVGRARGLPHRRRMPIVMFTAGEYEREALAAGADMFLRKPRDLGVLTGVVRVLMTSCGVRAA